MKHTLVLGFAAAALMLGVIPASATPGTGIASAPIVARGTTTETFVIGTPQTVTVTRTVKIRIKGKTYTRRVKVQVETVKPLGDLWHPDLVRYSVSAGDHQPQREQRLAHPSESNLRRHRAGRRHALQRGRDRVYWGKVRRQLGLF